MVLSREERVALLEKARAKKKELAEARKLANISEPEPEPPSETEKSVAKTKKTKTQKQPRRELDISNLEDVKKAEEQFEIKNELIRIKAPKKKTIIKRVIEVEEPSSEEEVQEEIVKVPRRNKQTKMETKEIPHPEKAPLAKQPDYFKDIFPS